MFRVSNNFLNDQWRQLCDPGRCIGLIRFPKRRACELPFALLVSLLHGADHAGAIDTCDVGDHLSRAAVGAKGDGASAHHLRQYVALGFGLSPHYLSQIVSA